MARWKQTIGVKSDNYLVRLTARRQYVTRDVSLQYSTLAIVSGCRPPYRKSALLSLELAATLSRD